ncbi:MAG: ABC-2 family transporter protein, partial [Gammaproteobacteria bacterium]|nr:ABC-2 family transporter protein [Gammaproteobacteria bacterium]
MALLCGGTIVYSFWLILASLSFWFIRIENILMIFWRMYTAGRWPVGLYPSWLKWLLTAVVPVSFAVTVPAQAVAGASRRIRSLRRYFSRRRSPPGHVGSGNRDSSITPAPARNPGSVAPLYSRSSLTKRVLPCPT